MIRWKQTAARLALAVSMVPAIAAVYTPAVAQSGPKQTTTPAPVVTTPSGLTYQQIPLSDAMVQSFIKTYPTVKAKLDAVAAKYKIQRNTKGIDGGFSAFLAASPQATADLNGAVTPSGYPDFQTWLNTTMSMLFATEWAVNGPQMDAFIAQAQSIGAAVGSNSVPNSPQAAAALAQAQALGINVTGTLGAASQASAGLGNLAAMRPTDANIKVVTPYTKQLQPLLKP
jgi:hypothetical protein